MLWVEPRSTSSHCGSENALDQRVDRFPSVAFDAGQLGPWIDDAVVGLPCAMFVVPQVAADAAGARPGATSPVSTSADPASMSTPARYRDGPDLARPRRGISAFSAGASR